MDFKDQLKQLGDRVAKLKDQSLLFQYFYCTSASLYAEFTSTAKRNSSPCLTKKMRKKSR